MIRHPFDDMDGATGNKIGDVINFSWSESDPTRNRVSTRTYYTGLKYTGMTTSGLMNFSYTKKYYVKTTTAAATLKYYVCSPNSSAYTVGSTYRNKTTL